MEKLSEKLRARLLAHAESKTWREIAAGVPLDVGQLHRFAKGTGKLGQDALDALDAYLQKRKKG
jgi:hypothetical protein